MSANHFVPYSLLVAAIGLAGTAIAARAGAGLVDARPTGAETAGYISTPSSAPSPAPIAGFSASGTEVPDEKESHRAYITRQASVPLLANNQILAFYGNPLSRNMGILGEYPKEELARILLGYARRYNEGNGRAGIVPAFYIIYGTCWPEGEIGYLPDALLREYIDFAAKEGFLVFIDHQIGKFPVEEATRRLLPWLAYPNVHLALDPEWRTDSPMEVIGSITAEEVNEAQAMVDAYLRDEGIPGTRMLVVHQFVAKMIAGRERVRADFPRVALIHTADGFGSPGLKRKTYAANAAASNMPLKGFKLFFETQVEGAGYDDPLLSPDEVLALDPRPELIIYQ